MAVKFPLKMADGVLVRTIEELREHFDLVSVLTYYNDGRLVKWLKNGYYDIEAEKVAGLDSLSNTLKSELCKILGISDYEEMTESVELEDVTRKAERVERLKMYTAEEEILEAIDNVAFTQNELEKLLDKDTKKIYLCGKYFNIPGDISCVTFIGVNHPTIYFLGDGVGNKSIFRDVEFGSDELLKIAIAAKDLKDEIVWWIKAAEAGHAEAQFELAERYSNGTGVDKNPEEAVKWYLKSAEQGYAKAQNVLGNCYNNGFGVEQNYELAVKWYLEAAKQGEAVAQNSLGILYWNGKGIEQSYEEANSWFLKAAEQGYEWAQRNIGFSYQEGKGIEKNKDKAIEWFQKAIEQGNADAKKLLIKLSPNLFDLFDVIIYTVGGCDNLREGSMINVEMSKIDICVHDRTKVDIEIIEQYGTTNVWVEREYFFYERIKKPSVGRMMKRMGGLFKNMLTDSMPDLSEPEMETISEDLGEGCVHMEFINLSADMEEIFNEKILSKCSESSLKTAERKYEIKMECDKKLSEFYFGNI